jgi:dimethylhistidine N-methyltransferase
MIPTLMRFTDRHPTPADFHAEVLHGLTASQKWLPPKLFYDARGCRLFEALCETPEYYLTRTELGILRDFGAEIALALGDGCILIEPGSGNSQKVRRLLQDLHPAAYLPLDIAKDHLLQSARRLAADHPRLRVHAVCLDYNRGLEGLDFEGLPPEGKKVVFFPGSTIGNFEPLDATAFLRRVARLVGPGGGLLIGVDLKKDPELLHRAYNDAAGITREFNLNLLRRINTELFANFDADRFAHYAFYHARKSRIEMHLVSRCAQKVTVGRERIHFVEGETIHTENAYKYTVAQFRALAATAGFRPEGYWSDREKLFSVQYFRVVG